jgi:hypothetical protein
VTGRRPGGGVPTTVRLWAAAGLSLLPLGMVWTVTPGFQTAGTTILGGCDSDGYCTPDVYTPGIFLPGSVNTAAQAPIRVFLVGAFVALAVAAARRRTPQTRRIARAGTACLLVAALLAAGHGASRPFLCVLAALLLAAPPAWRSTRSGPVFGIGRPPR